MTISLIGRLQLVALCLLLGGMTGCTMVSSKDLAAVEAKANSAMSEARNAGSAASSAMKTAEAAQATATAAAAAADAAKSAADAAMSCCNENKDRIERMFEQTMKK